MPERTHPGEGLLGAAELSAHNFVDGFAIGLGFQVDAHVGLVITFAVISHDFADGINTVTEMLNWGNPAMASLRMLLLDAIAPVLGAATTLLLTVPARALLYILPSFAGGLLHLGASDLLPEAHESNPPAASLVLSLASFLSSFLLTRCLNVCLAATSSRCGVLSASVRSK
jgi:ZIP family zinc transporter